MSKGHFPLLDEGQVDLKNQPHALVHPLQFVTYTSDYPTDKKKDWLIDATYIRFKN